MSKISRRRLVIAGLAAAAGASGLGVAAKLAERYGLIPPDAGVLYGAGETLTYAAQRILTRHSLAREFSPRDISKAPFANEVIPPLSEEFHRMQKGGFTDWRLTIDGMVAASLILAPGAQELPLSHPSHADRVRRRLVIYRRMERCAPVSHP